MKPNPHASPTWLRNLFFWAGVLATVCYRAIVILNHYSTHIALAAWYVGTVGFIVYFWHRYTVSEKRVELIKANDLIRAVRTSNLTQAQIEANEYILETLKSTKEKWMYMVIFVSSVLAIIVGIYLDFFAR